ncbi:MAG: hypothetical protein BroJett018_49170 [Chloroflexota bacterium]|nr:MAG: hypothetical protein BroJett018_49170 [Chloroflexota bacterium]
MIGNVGFRRDVTCYVRTVNHLVNKELVSSRMTYDQPMIAQLVEALRSQTPRVQKSAYKRLVGLGVLSVQPLLNIIRDDDVQVQMLAKQILVDIGKPSIPALIAALDDDKLRTPATSVLSRFGAWPAKELVGALKSPNPKVAGAAATTLRLIGEPVIEALVEAMDGFDAARRYSVIEILASIRNPKITPILIAALRDPDRDVAIRAINALTLVGDRNSVMPLLDTIAHPDIMVATRAIAAVGRLVDNRVLEALIAALIEDERELVKTMVLRTLGLRNDKIAIPFIEPLLEHPSRNVRDAARLALHQLEYDFGNNGET